MPKLPEYQIGPDGPAVDGPKHRREGVPKGTRSGRISGASGSGSSRAGGPRGATGGAGRAAGTRRSGRAVGSATTSTGNWQADRAAQQVLAARDARREEFDRLAALIAQEASASGEPILAVDPGDKHVGLACFLDGRCTSATETEPDTAVAAIRYAVRAGWISILVVEKWQLYADKAKEQTGSEMPTPEMIGKLKQIVQDNNLEVAELLEASGGQVLPTGWLAGDGREGRRFVRMVLQPASIQTPTKALLRKEQIARVDKRNHATSAQLHGWHFLYRGRGKLERGEDGIQLVV